MQLILEPESTTIQVKMSALEEESLNEKSIVNSIPQELNSVPNGNKENVQTVNNIIIRNEESDVNIEKMDVVLTETPIIEEDIRLEEKMSEKSIEVAKEEEESPFSNIAVCESDGNGEKESTIVLDSIIDKLNSEISSETNQDESEISNQEINESKDIQLDVNLKSGDITDEGKCDLNDCGENIEKIVGTPLEINNVCDTKENHSILKNITQNEDLVISKDEIADDDLEETPFFIDNEHSTETEHKEQEINTYLGQECDTVEMDIDEKIETESDKVERGDENTPRTSDLENIITKDVAVRAETMDVSKENKIPIDIEVEPTTVPIIENDSALENIAVDVNITENIVLDKSDKSTIQDITLENITNIDESQQGATTVEAVSQQNTPYSNEHAKDTISDSEIQEDNLECENVSIKNYPLDDKNRLSPKDLSESLDLNEFPVVDSSKIEEEESEGTIAEIMDEVTGVDVNKEVITPIQEDIEILKEPATINNKTSENIKDIPLKSRLSNTLDILSDDDDDPPVKEPVKPSVSADTLATVSDKQCINIDDDDDIMLIDEDINTKKCEVTSNFDKDKFEHETRSEESPEETQKPEVISEFDSLKHIESAEKDISKSDSALQNNEVQEMQEEKIESQKPLLSDDYLISCKKNLADMTRDDLEEFCVLKIVESIVDRINLSEYKNKQKNMAQNLDEYKKKTVLLAKQLRDLQVVLKSVQEEQKKAKNVPVTPLKITRSVGMQVLMTDKSSLRRKPPQNNNLGVMTPAANNNTNKPSRAPANPSPRSQKANLSSQQQIPVPRLVPATNNVISKNPPATAQANSSNPGKVVPSLPNGVRNSPPAQKVAEKRTHNRIQSVTVDLTDDEPPSKIPTHSNPVRLVSPQNLLAPRQQTPQQVNSPRKVYIPISGPQNQHIRAGQTIVLKTVTQATTPRPRQPNQIVRMPNVRMRRAPGARHPAPLPDAMKQYQSPNWKSLPPAPDLKLSKVENGIVISWKIDGYHEDSYEEISSYQLYAYQETSAPPNTALWKKIGDVKALPLPMACTLTQFMAGFKYYFAVRAVDIRSRLGPFSLPGSILLLNKM